MRFESVFARAFGPFAGKTLELAPGMTVVYGPNEAGKSSWHAALFAGLCGRKRGRGAGSKEEQEFRERHRPWDGTKWEVGALVRLEDGRRVELKHDLEGKVACEARDADMWRDLSAEIMHEGSPDGAKFLGLDRRAFLATACVRQADLLGIREDSGLLQEHLQRAAATSGADATAAAALSRIDEFRREEIGLERANAVKPLQRAIKELERREQALSEARAGRAAYLGLAEQLEILERAANEARTQVRVLRARLAQEEADEWRARAARASALAARFPDGAPSGVAAADTLAQDVAAAGTDAAPPVTLRR
jgi:exonuclease SbcC